MTARTEPPTPRRLREARRRGEVAVSRELTGAAALAGGLAALAATGPALARELARAVARVTAEALGASPPSATVALAAAARALCAALLVPCGAAAALALGCGLTQTGGLFTLHAARFDARRLDPGRGVARLLSGAGVTAVALATAKVSAVLAAAGALAPAALVAAAATPRLAPRALLAVLPRLAWRVALPLAALALLLGAVDLAFARRRHRRELRMTRAEVRRERREDEGDPRLAAERRRLARAQAAGPLRRATCLVVNPTHVAVALRHDPRSDEAPRVVAKALGPAAARLRAVARRAGVPVVRDVPLARALFRLAEIGDQIPEELYDAAAAVLVHLRGGAPGAQP